MGGLDGLMPTDAIELNTLHTLSYVVFAVLAAYIWEWILSIPDEIEMLSKNHKRLTPLVVYFLSRIGAVSFVAATAVSMVSSTDNCAKVMYIAGAFYALSLSATALLFFFRVRAVYSNSKFVTAFFGGLWALMFGCSFLVPFGMHSAPIGNTNKCNLDCGIFILTNILLNTTYDTLIFLTISWRLASLSSAGETPMIRLKSFFKGDGLPALSRSLLKDGQVYYFVSIIFNIFCLIMVFGPTMLIIHRPSSMAPNIALESAMACRLFRSVKLGVNRDRTSTWTMSLPSLASFSSPKNLASSMGLRRPHDDAPPEIPLGVLVTQSIETSRDYENTFDKDLRW